MEIVLLVDIDPQANLTRCAGVENPDDLSYPIYKLFGGLLKDEPVLPTEEYILSNGRLDLIPSHKELASGDKDLLGIIGGYTVLSDLLAS